MEDVTKGKAGATQPPEQSRPNNPSSPLAPTKPPLSPGSPVHVWQKPYCMSQGGAGAISTRPRSHMKLASSSFSQEADYQSRKHPIPDPCKIPTNVTAGAVSGVGDDAHAARTSNAEVEAAEKSNLERNFDPNMDPKKLRRILSNRLSAQRSIVRKMEYVGNLEKMAKEYEKHVAILHSQIEAVVIQKQLLILERNTLAEKLRAWEQTTIFKEAELEKNKAEVSMLRELHKIPEQLQTQQAMMFNWNSDLNQTSFNLNPDVNDDYEAHTSGRKDYCTDATAQHGGETSNMEVNIEQKQGQVLMTNWENILQTSEANEWIDWNSAQLPGMNPPSMQMSKHAVPDPNFPNRFM